MTSLNNNNNFPNFQRISDSNSQTLLIIFKLERFSCYISSKTTKVFCDRYKKICVYGKVVMITQVYNIGRDEPP